VLTERNRAVLHRRLSEMVGDEEAVSEMLSNFASDDQDPFVTRSVLALTESRLRSEMHKQTTQIVMWMAGLVVTCSAIVITAVGVIVN
jgi:hypothetical protein